MTMITMSLSDKELRLLETCIADINKETLVKEPLVIGTHVVKSDELREAVKKLKGLLPDILNKPVINKGRDMGKTQMITGQYTMAYLQEQIDKIFGEKLI